MHKMVELIFKWGRRNSSASPPTGAGQDEPVVDAPKNDNKATSMEAESLSMQWLVE